MDIRERPMRVLVPQASRTAASRREVHGALGGPHTLEDIERKHVRLVMASAPTLDKAARVLGIDASTLWRVQKKYGSGEG
ncbi:helix-turn-helix domain-containing protein [Myxococcus sp. Y35]|uniref:helix-turn-helix domain-containing protein n=1 Tax=Pseudomyxococcus flavus TaxID=3115648 RepID=UPI003CE75ADA